MSWEFPISGLISFVWLWETSRELAQKKVGFHWQWFAWLQSFACIIAAPISVECADSWWCLTADPGPPGSRTRMDILVSILKHRNSWNGSFGRFKLKFKAGWGTEGGLEGCWSSASCCRWWSPQGQIQFSRNQAAINHANHCNVKAFSWRQSRWPTREVDGRDRWPIAYTPLPRAR